MSEYLYLGPEIGVAPIRCRAACHDFELLAYQKLAGARDVLDGIVIGHVGADLQVAYAVARLVEAAGDDLSRAAVARGIDVS